MSSSASVFIQAFAPFSSLHVSLPINTPVEDIYQHLRTSYPDLPPTDAGLVLSRLSGHAPSPTSLLADLIDEESDILTLRLSPRLLGGKGGFGSQLRAAGGRMSSQKTSNNDSCRDLSGRRLSTIKEAKALAEYLENEPARLKADKEAKRAKLEALEKRLGITPGASGSGTGKETEPVAGKKHRFDDTEYIEQSREMVDNVKNAVSAGLRKKKKAKLSPTEQKPDPVAESAAPLAGTKTLVSAGDSGVVTEELVTSSAVLPAAAVGVASA